MFRIVRYSFNQNGVKSIVDVQEYKDKCIAIETLQDWTKWYPKCRVVMEYIL